MRPATPGHSALSPFILKKWEWDFSHTTTTTLKTKKKKKKVLLKFWVVWNIYQLFKENTSAMEVLDDRNCRAINITEETEDSVNWKI